MNQTNDKNKILEAWIMVEHLSEGTINLKDKSILTFDEPDNENYYDLFKKKIEKRFNTKKGYDNCGIVIYFDIFSFKEGVIDFLRSKYKLSPSEEEINYGYKFSFALYFDKNLKLNSDNTFFTESSYIRKYRDVPTEREFLKFEEDFKKKCEDLFECPEEDDYKLHFNRAISLILRNNGISTNQCRIKMVNNLETDEVNLHSFFVKDLEKAKSISSNNLDSYILGLKNERINLDSRLESNKCNIDIFDDILQPKNYPIARFPSNPKYSLAFMQQVAVNLAIGFDNEQIRSVNGPPGTGKTTLLKDIFAEYCVKQAYEMACLSEKTIKGSDKTKYWENASIGIVPTQISEKEIVVASSNNGAVQNIVNELPLVSQIDDEFLSDIFNADYFKFIANSKVRKEWKKDENGQRHIVLSQEMKDDGNQFWGLFSLEGGRKENMEYIVTVLEHVVKYLDEEYVPNQEIYADFKSKYEKVQSYKNQRQNIYEKIAKRNQYMKILDEKSELFDSNKSIKEQNLNKYKLKIEEQIKKDKFEISRTKELLQEYKLQLLNSKNEKSYTNQCIEALKLQKPGFFACRKRKKEYRDKNKVYSDKLQEVIINENEISNKIKDTDMRLSQLENNISDSEKSVKEEINTFSQWCESKNREIKLIEQIIDNLNQEIEKSNVKEFDYTVDYETLQLSNPWFDIEYRKMQSKLFIESLKVRKQFLYDNKKNLKAACIIWSEQKKYQDNRILVSEAWHWINLVIPVISSTFASFSKMCVNLEQETIGNLFVDEAGQALPQASVGAIFRSKNVTVVGDPSQIKPVLTLDANILDMFGKHYGVSPEYLSEDTSTQTLVDKISKYGFYKDKNKSEWIGIPLWVHRRCKHPMFDIANEISYGGNMVQGVKEKGYAEWIDISGNANDKYVTEQGLRVRDEIKKMIDQNPDIIDRDKDDIIYVISPFKNVAYQLSQELKSIKFTRYDKNNKPTNVGTVHTFQGKEAKIVFLVLGADQKSKGAANWAMGTNNPNIMNVAATRAKEKFYIVGDKELYLSLKSDVIDCTDRIIRSFNESSL